MKRIGIIFLLSLISSLFVNAQEVLTNTVKGTIIDAQSQSPLSGVSVFVVDSDPVIGGITDEYGKFRLEEVPIGRVSIQASMIDYKPILLNNLIVNTGKELVLNLEMEEMITTLDEIEIIDSEDKTKALNEMTTVSTRMFSVEESKRYAGTLGDPSRMAKSFAGVSNSGDSRNDIIIRGNSPLGLLWRLDGMTIPNPNHFGSLGTTGGPVSILNNNLLANSDFMTGAFSSSYGDALSGVFDLKMRTGNSDKHEFTGQIGFNGFEFDAEGPISKGNNSSYLIAGRWSTLEVIKEIGLNIGYAAVPQYKDLTFKLDFPSLKFGRWSLFGMGGLSYIELLDENSEEGTITVSPASQDTYYGSDMGVLGLSNLYFFNKNTSQFIGLTASGVRNTIKVDSLYGENKQNKVKFYGNNSSESRLGFTYYINKKFSAKNTMKIGTFVDWIFFNYADSVLNDQDIFNGLNYRTLTDTKENSVLVQGYVEWQHKFSDELTMNSGLHYQQFLLNSTNSIEPRLGLKWQFTPKQTLSIAGGLHSQRQASSVIFYETPNADGSYTQTNRDLGFTKSIHAVLGYDFNFSSNFRLKVETYYQSLYDIPVEQNPSIFSASNIGADFTLPNVDSLLNNGTGTNYGIEFTLEKFFSNNYYFLLTTSIYESKYTGSDGVERNTAFNGNFQLNALGGVEFNLDKSNKKVFTFDTKVTYAGGKRYIPIDLEQSKIENEQVNINSQAYDNRLPDYFRTDIKVGFKLNGKKVTQEWAFDLQNVFNTQNVFQRIYNPKTNSITTDYQIGLFPMMTYRILF